ncbi:hypothetical protein AHAS_Ahas18G0145600 [Arachis hypogaea]
MRLYLLRLSELQELLLVLIFVLVAIMEWSLFCIVRVTAVWQKIFGLGSVFFSIFLLEL